METIGRTRWAIREGFIWSTSSFSERALGIRWNEYRILLAARGTQDLRFKDLDDAQPIPRATDDASVFESEVPILVQYARLDSGHAEVALLSTVAFAEG